MFTPTKEQVDIAKGVGRGEDIKVIAGPGTGKSSTLRYICQENKYKNFLSVTFNKANAVEADEHPDKPSNVDYKTSHGLAYREIIDFKMRKKLHYSMMYQEVPDTLASDIIVEYHRALEGSKKSTKDVQKEITELIRLFCNSDKASLTDFIESCSFEFLADTIEELICVEQALPAYAELAEEYWKLLIDKESPEKISHDIYLKLFQLRSCKIKGYDVILVDECLPGDSYVQTEKGNIKIRNLVTDYDLGIPVPLIKSYNILTDSFEYKPMVGSLISKNREVIEIRTEGLNKLRCTPNHKILTQRGYVEAGHLIVGEDLIFLDTPTNQKTKILLNSDQLQIVLGSCLGDGFLEKRSKFETYRCKLIQGEKQLEYLKWKAACLNLQVPDSPNVTSGYTGNKTVYSSFYTPTFALPKPLANCWEDFNTLGLAIWYMDDGSFESNRATIHCNTFTDTKAKFFQNLLKKNFSLDVSIHKNKEYNYFSFSVEETKKLFKLIHPFIHKDLAYKIDNPISSTRLLDNKFKNIGANFVSSVKLYSIETVYDITVEDNHNFITAATYYASGVIVHNCQDTNPCFVAILKNNNHMQQVLVGDPAQSLYGFRGAKNCFSKFDYKTYYLSTSFRFSPEIAEYINKVQPYTDSPLIVIGAGEHKELKTTAYIARTNAGTFTIVAEQLKKNPKLRFYTPTDMREIFSKLFHLQACFFNQLPQYPDKQLVHITNKVTLEEAVRYSDDIARLHKLGEAIRQSFKTLGEANTLFKNQSIKDAKDADFIVSTIHKFKGLEADKVTIAEDFISFVKRPKDEEEREEYDEFYEEEGLRQYSDEEIIEMVRQKLLESKTLANLLYVAVSRPKIALELPYYLQLFFKN